MKNITILGSTGSIGVSTLEIVTAHPDRFRVVAMTAGKKSGAVCTPDQAIFTPDRRRCLP